MIDLVLIGKRIRELRLKRGLTQTEFADILSVSFQAVSNWERGIAPPELENLVRIASYFGVLVDDLLSSSPHSEEVYIGVDGGGTKTEFAAVTASGRVLLRTVRSGSNPNDIGIDKTEELLSEGIKELLTEFPSARTAFCGVAGASAEKYSRRLTEALKKRFPTLGICVRSDALNLFAADDTADMVVISGTGSVVFVKQGEEHKRLGGWGYLLDSAGSAYDIGREALCFALGEEDARRSPSRLSLKLYERLSVKSAWDAINTVYREGKPYIASLSSVVFDAYAEGDENAEMIIDKSARALAYLIELGVKSYGAKPAALANGGLFEHHGDVMTSLISRYSNVKVTVNGLPPIYGACRRACTMAGADVGDKERFYENFKKSYEEIKI